MISFFRRFLTSWAVLALFAIILIAFVVTGFNTPGGIGIGGAGANNVAKVGGLAIPETELERRAQIALDAQRQQDPALDMAAFARSGQIDAILDQIINGRAVEAFARDNGMVASRRLVDGAIASIPAFLGPTGEFDRNAFQAILSERRINEGELRADFAREALTRQLLLPIGGGVRVPRAIVSPYATLLLEERRGRLVPVPAAGYASAAPVSPAELQAFYNANLARYTVPERRIVRYALFDRSRFDGKVAPTEAEVAADYRANAASYAGRETRSLTQAIVADEAQARAVLQRVRGGVSVADALRPLGLSPLTVASVDKATFARQTSAAVADAAFATPRGQLAPLARSGLGFHVVRVDAVQASAGRTLDQARSEITAKLAAKKADAALADLVAAIEDEIGDGATFDEVATKHGLTPAVTPAVTAAGAAPDQPGFALPAAVTPILRDVFQAEPDDDPVVATLAPNSFALWDLDRTLAAAPRPLASIAAQVEADLRAGRARAAARQAAQRIVDAINAGRPLPQGSEGVRAGAAQPIGGRRIELAESGQRVPPANALLFSMQQGRAKLLGTDDGWSVVVLDRVVPGDPRRAGSLVAATQAQLGRVFGDEYVQQFMTSVRAQVGVTRNEAAVATAKRNLAGRGR